MTKAKKNPCSGCDALCCRYIALPIENPETRDDFEDVRWYLCHEGISVFVEDGEWYISVKNSCRYICPETSKCLNYENRPKICRKHEADGCEHKVDEYGYELHFTDDKQMEEYIKVKFDNNLTPKGKKSKNNK